MSKLPVDELLRRACIYAERDQLALIDAHEGMLDDPEAVEARQFVDQLHAYRVKRWGKTLLEVFQEEATPVSVYELMRKGGKR